MVTCVEKQSCDWFHCNLVPRASVTSDPPSLYIRIAASGNEIGFVNGANVTAVMRSWGNVICKKRGELKIGA